MENSELEQGSKLLSLLEPASPFLEFTLFFLQCEIHWRCTSRPFCIALCSGILERLQLPFVSKAQFQQPKGTGFLKYLKKTVLYRKKKLVTMWLLDPLRLHACQILLPGAQEREKIVIPTGQWSEGNIQNILPHG